MQASHTVMGGLVVGWMGGVGQANRPEGSGLVALFVLGLVGSAATIMGLGGCSCVLGETIDLETTRTGVQPCTRQGQQTE